VLSVPSVCILLSPSGADSADRSQLAVLGAAPYLKNKHNQADLSAGGESVSMAFGEIGTTRSRASFFMNKFRRLGFVDYNGSGLEVDSSLLNVVPHG